jgi:hypothetical protein
MEENLFMLSNHAKNCVKKFIAWGGLAATAVYILDGNIGKALLIALIFGIAVALDEYYSR